MKLIAKVCAGWCECECECVCIFHSLTHTHTHSLTHSLTQLDGTSNIAHLPAPLSPHTAYQWRVDTVRALRGGADTDVTKGQVWIFSTGSDRSCDIAPHPPHPTCLTCTECEAALCPGLKGKGDVCRNCVFENSQELGRVGCWTNSGGGGRHAFIKKFCGIS